MATAAREKPRSSSSTARFSFQQCTSCPVKMPHGYFHDPDGDRASDPFTEQAKARQSLDGWILGGDIPQEQRAAIEEDIRNSGMPEVLPYMGPYTFRANESGQFLFFGDGPDSVIDTNTGIRSKKTARMVVEKNVLEGVFRQEEQQKLLDEIDASDLPENSPPGLPSGALGLLLLDALLGLGQPNGGNNHFEFVVENDIGDFVNHGIPGGFGIRTKADARVALQKGVDLGFVQVGDFDRLLKEIEASSLPE